MNKFVSEKHVETPRLVDIKSEKLSCAMLETMADARRKRIAWYPDPIVFETSKMIEAFCHRFGLHYE